MVKVLVKQGDTCHFLCETTAQTEISVLIEEIVFIYNKRVQITRLCAEIEDLAKHGISFPPNMVGLLEEQILELKLTDEWGEKYTTSEGYANNKDPLGRRNGKAPNEMFAKVLQRITTEVREKVSKDLIASDVCLNKSDVNEAVDILKEAVAGAYPMGLPPYDPIQIDFLGQPQANTHHVDETIEESRVQLWWAGKQLNAQKKLCDFIGKNEKTKITVKLQKDGQGPPAREPMLNADDQKAMLLHQYRRQEELRKLEQADDDGYLNSEWADSKLLHKSFQGLKDVRWKPT